MGQKCPGYLDPARRDPHQSRAVVHGTLELKRIFIGIWVWIVVSPLSATRPYRRVLCHGFTLQPPPSSRPVICGSFLIGGLSSSCVWVFLSCSWPCHLSRYLHGVWNSIEISGRKGRSFLVGHHHSRVVWRFLEIGIPDTSCHMGLQ